MAIIGINPNGVVNSTGSGNFLQNSNFSASATPISLNAASIGISVNIAGGRVSDTIQGGSGNDTLLGNEGDDFLAGNNGNDILDGGLGADTLFGGDGNDFYVVDNLGDQVIDSGGNDTLFATIQGFPIPNGIEVVIVNGPTGQVTIDPIISEAIEGVSPGVLRISLDNTETVPITIPLVLDPTSTAVSGIDFELPASSVTIPPNTLFVDVPVNALADSVLDNAETIVVNLGFVAGFTQSGSPATITIIDPNVQTGELSIVAINPSATEGGNEGVLRISRDQVGSTPLTIPLVIDPSSTATVGTDFTPLPTTVTIPPGLLFVDVPVTALTDTILDNNEEVVVNLGAVPGFTTVQDSAIVTILDPNVQTGTLTLAPVIATATEGQQNGVFRVSRDQVSTLPLTIPFALDPSSTAASGVDFTSLPSSVTIPAGALIVDVPVVALADAVADNNETVVVSLGSVPGFTLNGSPSAVTILDSNVGASLSIFASTSVAFEGGQDGILTVSRTGETTNALSVPIVLTGNATNGADYALLPTTVIIPAGQSSVNLTVDAQTDGLIEPAETVTATVQPLAGFTIANASASVEIRDADQLQTLIISAPVSTVTEGNAAQIQITRSVLGSTPLVVPITVTSTATSGLDFTELPTTITIPAGSLSASLLVNSLTDTIVEGAETVTVSVGSVPGFVQSGTPATVTILDAVAPTLTLTPINAVAIEGGSTGVLRISRDTVSTLPVTVPLVVETTSTAIVDQDFTALPASVTIPPGALFVEVSVTALADAVADNNETVVVSLGSVPGFTLNGSPSTITILEPNIGTTGDDSITGDDTDNSLIGLAGNDTLNGGAGNDTITGGEGVDVLTGGAGIDRFVFQSLDEIFVDPISGEGIPDNINDFDFTGGDLIVLLSSGFPELNVGSTIDPIAFQSVSNPDAIAADGNVRILYVGDTGAQGSVGRLYFTPNGTVAGGLPGDETVIAQFTDPLGAPLLNFNQVQVLP